MIAAVSVISCCFSMSFVRSISDDIQITLVGKRSKIRNDIRA